MMVMNSSAVSRFFASSAVSAALQGEGHAVQEEESSHGGRDAQLSEMHTCAHEWDARGGPPLAQPCRPELPPAVLAL